MNNLIDQLRAAADLVPPWIGYAVGGVAALLGLLMLRLMAASVIASVRRRGAHSAARPGFNAKLEIGFAVVQIGLSYIIITGVFEFFRGQLAMPWVEAAILAVFVEAAVWTSVGFITEYGRSMVEARDGSGEMVPATGWGTAGPFFWIFSISGGTLAVLGSHGSAVAVGRTVIVVVGTAMWVLRLLRSTRRANKPSRFRFTPRRVLIDLGWLEPEPEDQADENRTWKIQRLARAIRWSNSKNGWVKYLGHRSLLKLAESTTEDVLREAQMRVAAVYVLRDQAGYDSTVMRSIIEGQKATATKLAELTQQRTLDDANRADSAGGTGSAGGGKTPNQGDDRRKKPDTTVSSLSEQVTKDRTAVIAVALAVKSLTGEQYPDWDSLRTAIQQGKLLNQVSDRSKVTKPRIARTLPRAEELVPEMNWTAWQEAAA